MLSDNNKEETKSQQNFIRVSNKAPTKTKLKQITTFKQITTTLLSYRNQSIDFQNKLIDSVPYNWPIGH